MRVKMVVGKFAKSGFIFYPLSRSREREGPA